VTGRGSAFVCRDAENRITQALTLDTFEGRERFGYTIPSRTADPLEQVATARQRIAGDRARFALLQSERARHSWTGIWPTPGRSSRGGERTPAASLAERRGRLSSRVVSGPSHSGSSGQRSLPSTAIAYAVDQPVRSWRMAGLAP
jgi:hypothetical protein